jgi:hypothetical protein
MRNTRWISSLTRTAGPLVLAGGLSFCSWGCHQHYYYYGNPPAGVQGCPPGTTVMPSAVTTTGPLCDVPAAGTTVGQASPRSTTVSDGRRSRVVVSEPSTSSPLSRFGWRAADPDTPPALTEVQGALEDSAVKK